MPAPSSFPWVIPEYCEGCTSCVAACPKRLLAMREIAEDTEVAWMDDPDACTGCGRCAEACGFGAIAMTAHVDEAKERFRERFAACAAGSRDASDP